MPPGYIVRPATGTVFYNANFRDILMTRFWPFYAVLTAVLPCTTLAGTLEEIVISASRLSADNGHDAVSQSSLSDAWLEDLYVESFDNLASFVPGLFIQEQSVNSAGFAVRGMTSDNVEATQTPRVSVWLHGMDISRSQGAYLAMHDLAQVDVLKGPVASLFGRGGQIGGVNIIPRFAELENSTGFRLATGSFNELKASGFANLQMGERQAARLAVYKHQRDGYIENSDGADLMGIDTEAARLSLSFNISDLSIKIQANHEENTPPTVAFQSFDYPAADPWSEADLNNADELAIDREISDLYTRLEWQLDEQQVLRWSFLDREVKSHDTFDPDGTRLNLIRASENADFSTFESQLLYQFTLPGWQGQIGADYFYEDVAVQLAATINEQLAIRLPAVQQVPPLSFLWFFGISIDNDLFNPDGSANPYTGFALSSRRLEQQTEWAENESISLFTDHSLALGDNTDLNLGLRYSMEKLRTDIYTPPYDDGGETTLADFNLFLKPDDNSDYSEADSKSHGWAGRIAVTHYLAGRHPLYVSYARGRRPDMLNFTEQSELEELQAETVDSYELGLTWQLPDNFSRLQLSLYHYDFKHFATQRAGVTALSLQSDDNASASVNGVEVAWMQYFADSFLLFANLGYNDALFDESDIIQGENRFRYAPLWSGSLSLSHDFALPDNWLGRITGQSVFQSEVFFEDDNTSNNGRNRQGSYQVLNLYGDFIYRQWTINLFVKNLADKHYMIDAGNFGQLFGMPTFVPAIGRHFGAGVAFRY